MQHFFSIVYSLRNVSDESLSIPVSSSDYLGIQFFSTREEDCYFQPAIAIDDRYIYIYIYISLHIQETVEDIYYLFSFQLQSIKQVVC